MSHQYLSWFRQGTSYPSGNKLLNEQSIRSLKSTLLPSGVEVHESVQRYDGLGRVLFTPIYSDFDGEDKLSEILKFIDKCESEFSLTPEIFFSGNRGFHLFINTPVSHTYPHLVVKRFMSIMCPRVNDKAPNHFDEQMYGSRHLLRSEGSVHFKSGLYKTKIDLNELNNGSYRNKSKKQRVTERDTHQSPTLDLFLNSLYEMVNREIKEAEEKYKLIKSEIKGEVPSCIQALIKQGPVNGQNNYILTLIARSFNSVGVSIGEAIAEVSSNPSWMGHSSEINSVFKSTYKQVSRFGCKNNETLKAHCDPFCPFNELTINI